MITCCSAFFVFTAKKHQQICDIFAIATSIISLLSMWHSSCFTGTNCTTHPFWNVTPLCDCLHVYLHSFILKVAYLSYLSPHLWLIHNKQGQMLNDKHVLSTWTPTHCKPIWQTALTRCLKNKSHRSFVVFVWPPVWGRHQWRGNGSFCLQSRAEPLLAPSMLRVCHVSRAAGGSDLFLPKWQDPLWKTPRWASKTTMLFLWRGKME